MSIAIDIDEVIIEFIDKYMKFVAEKGFKKVNYEDVFCYDLWDVLKIEKELAVKLMDEYNLSDNFSNINFVNGAKEGVDFLNKKHNICFITSRSKGIYRETRDLIFEEFGSLRDRVIFSGDFSGEGKTKDEICKDFGIRIIIEDSGADSLKYAKNEINVLLLDKPWNQEFEHENICRCKDWGEILEKIKEVEDGKIF